MQLAEIPHTTATPQFLMLRRDQFSSGRWRPPASTPAQYSTVSSPPSQVLLSEPLAPGWRLLKPVWLTIEVDHSAGEPQVVVYDSLVKAYGVGASPQEAISEYKSMLLDLYEELEDSQAILSPSLRMRWHTLRALIARA